MITYRPTATICTKTPKNLFSSLARIPSSPLVWGNSDQSFLLQGAVWKGTTARTAANTSTANQAKRPLEPVIEAWDVKFNGQGCNKWCPKLWDSMNAP